MQIKPLAVAAVALATILGVGFITQIDWNTQIKNKPFYSVKDAPFFAKGDGITDDTAAIQAALTAAGTRCGLVYFPHGTYMMSVTAGDHTGTVIPSCVEMAGESNTGAVIKLKSAAFNGEWFSSSGTHNITIRDLTFDGANAPINSGYGVVSTSGTTVNWTSGSHFYTDGTWSGQAVSIYVNNVLSYYVIDHVVNSTQMVLTTSAGTTSGGSYFMSGLEYSVLGFFDVDHLRVQHCRFINVYPTLVTAFYATSAYDGGGDIVFDHNYFQVTAASPDQNEGINLGTAGVVPVNGVKITNNVFNGTGMLIVSNGGLIEGNTITNWQFGAGYTAMYSPVCASNIIAHNVIAGGTGIDANATRVNGIEDWCPYDTISDNQVSGNYGDGIDVGGRNSVVTGNIALNNGISIPGLLSGITCRYATTSANCTYSTFTGNRSLDTNPNPALGTQGYGFAIQTNGTGTYATYITVDASNNFNYNTENPTNYLTAQGVVNTGGEAVTWVSGSPFVTTAGNWVGMTIVIGGVEYSIAAVNSATSLSLTTSAGSQSGVAYSIPAFTNTAAAWARILGTPPRFPYCASWTPGTIAAGATAFTQVTVSGAQMGSTIAPPSFSLNANGVLFYGYVYQPNAITFVAYNLSGASQTLAAGQICTTVTMPLGYSNY